MTPTFRTFAAALLAATCLTTTLPARAQPAPPAAAPAAAEPGPAPVFGSPEWISGIKFGAQFEAGVVFNTTSPSNGLNVGQMFTDRSNQATLDQALITLGRTIDPKTTGFDVGFKLQFMYGADARYTHFLGVLDYATSDRYQVDITEANVTMRLPVLTEGGIDVKAGMYSTPMGLETIDPSTNPFYSHSYIFNYGLPLKHTGLYTTTHLSDVVDLYLGADTGINTTFGSRQGDNNGAAAFLGGLGFNLLDGKLTILALTHIGPENAVRLVGPLGNSRQRYSNDILVTYKVDDKLTLTTEANLIRDDLANANGFGIAQYVGYALTDSWTLNGRAEIFRDDNGFFVAAFPRNLDPVNALGGFPNQSFSAGPTTFSEFTVGATWKPTMPTPIAALMVRPELRYDQALTSNKPFSGRSNALTLAADVVIGF